MNRRELIKGIAAFTALAPVSPGNQFIEYIAGGESATAEIDTYLIRLSGDKHVYTTPGPIAWLYDEDEGRLSLDAEIEAPAFMTLSKAELMRKDQHGNISPTGFVWHFRHAFTLDAGDTLSLNWHVTADENTARKWAHFKLFFE